MTLTFDDLNPSQRAAVTHKGGPILVIAGAGSGKTRVATRRIAYLMTQGAEHHQIIALTFTNKAAGEMRERLNHLMQLSPWVGTFHSFGLRLLREWSPVLGVDANFVIYDPSDCEKLVKQLAQESSIKVAPSSLLNWISLCKNQAQRSEEVKNWPGDPSEQIELASFLDLYRRYEQAMQSYNAIDFDDLLFLSVRLLREHSHLQNELQQRWRYFLVDEYQDTNFCQYEMVRLLAGPKPELFVVGDPDQSIYSWRGADINNILNFARDFPGATTICLEENYRSSPQILSAASALIANNQTHYKKILRSTRPDSHPVTLAGAHDDRKEAQFVADEIQNLLRHGFSFQDIAVFYRTNFQSRAIEDVLRREGIPYAISGGVSFYQRKEIKDILAYARVTLFDYDRLALERALSVPKRGLGDKTLNKLFLHAQEKNISALELMSDSEGMKAADIPAKARQTLQQFQLLIRDIREEAENLSISDFLTKIVESSNYMLYLSQQEDQAIERMENVNELIAKAMEWADSREDSLQESPHDEEISLGLTALRAFMEEMNLGPQEVMTSDETASSITLMTVHNAKGLEFPIVFVVGLEEMLFPHIYHKSDEILLEEERRLLYVGMTRAQKLLYLSYAQSRFLWGSVRQMRASRFIHELPSDELDIRHVSYAPRAWKVGV